MHIHGSTGDFPGVEMRGGQLIIEGDVTRPCANMKDGTCVILGRVHEMIPTFEKIDRRVLPEWKITADIYKGDVANRGKGTLMVKTSRFSILSKTVTILREPCIPLG